MVPNLKLLYSFLWKYKFRFAIFWIFLLIFAVLENIRPVFYKNLTDAGLAGNIPLIWQTLILFGVVRLIEIITEFIARSIFDTVFFKASRDARMTVINKIHALDFAFHLSKSTGSLISAVKRGDSAFESLALTLNMQLSRILISFFVMTYFLLQVRVEAVVIIVGSSLLILTVGFILVKNNMYKRKLHNDAEDNVSAIITDNLINFDTVKFFAKEKAEQERLSNAFEPWYQTLVDYGRSFRWIETFVNLAVTASMLLLFIFTLQDLASAKISPGQFILVLTFALQFYPQIYNIVWRMRELSKSFADLEKYFELLRYEIQVKDPKKTSKVTQFAGHITYKNVTFHYPDNKNIVLDDFTLDIKQGQSIAFVGKSGQGKSTLVKLLMRFYDVQKGEILIDGTNIKKFSKSDLRSRIGVVPQEPILFNNTIGFNIGYGAEEPTPEQVKAAAKMAYLDEFIETLPEKYETNVGERGIKLSGGQKQRLAIARMILANPDIVIFDEATSHLDSESEQAIQDAFWKAVKGKTAIIVAHRLSTIVRADTIVVIQNGQIAEKGSHRLLVNKPDGLYAHYWNLQTNFE